MSAFLAIEHLTVEIHNTKVLDNISFEIQRGTRLGIVGESGSGKSMTARAIFGDLPSHAAFTGKVLVEGISILELPKLELDKMRRSVLSLVPQNPGLTLDPSMKIGRQISKALTSLDKNASAAVISLLARMGFEGNEAEIINRYPHQLSGGQRQRVAIAIALASNPKLLVADEPTSSLDVLVARDIIEVIDSYSTSVQSSVVLITHNLEEVADLCSEVVVLYQGRVVEMGPVAKILSHPEHPYTNSLVGAYTQLFGT